MVVSAPVPQRREGWRIVLDEVSPDRPPGRTDRSPHGRGETWRIGGIAMRRPFGRREGGLILRWLRLWTHGVLAVLLLCAAIPAAAESRLEAFRRLRQEADAMAGRDDRAAVEKLQAAHLLVPTSPGTLILLAAAQARAGDAPGAIATLDRYSRLGLTLDLSTRPELAALRGRADFHAVGRRLAANGRPRGRLSWLTAIGGKGPLEGVAYDPISGRIFVSLVGGRSILVGTPEAGFRVLAGPDVMEAGVFGLAWDARRRTLWAAAASGDQSPGSEGAQASALLRVDPDSGRVEALYGGPPGGQLGDVALGPDGSVYVSDSFGGQILRLKPGAERLERMTQSPEMGSAQGMAVRGGALVVADYPTGLWRIDLATGAAEPIAGPPGVSLIGIDGLADSGRALYATQNGLNPHRILQLTLSADARRVKRAEVLLSGRPDAPDLALAALAGDELVFSARSGWADGASPVLAAITPR